MKTFCLALSVFAALVLGYSPAWALLGTDDHVPGYDVLVPFFLVSIPGQGSMNTLIALTEIGKSQVDFHCTVFGPGASHCVNKTISLTKGDVAPISVLALLEDASSSCRSSLEIDLDHDGIKDHYAGYIMFHNLNKTDPKNQVMGVLYLVNLLNGVSAGVNLPSIEVDETLSITDPKLVNQDRHTERFSANAMWRAKQYIALPFQPSNIQDATYFRLLPRFALIDDTYNNYWFIWADRGCNSSSVIICDEDENFLSTSLPSLSPGLNILDFKRIVPGAWLHSMPVGGWVDFTLKRDYPTAFDGDLEILGYTFIFRAVSSKISSDTLEEPYAHNEYFAGFAALTETHRDAGTFD